MKAKGIIALILVLLTAMVFPLQIQAVSVDTVRVKDSELASVGYDIDILEAYIEDVEGFKEYVIKEAMAFNEHIYIGDYDLPVSEEVYTSIAFFLCKEIPELFHVNSVGYTVAKDKLMQMNVEFNCAKEDYDRMYSQCEKVANEIVADILTTEGLTEAEKALLIHDRLALRCSYDKKLEHENIFNMYGALVEGYAVCEGYTKAYMYLLNKVGIKSDICSSDALNHSWNIVYIDGVPYHADVTWDDIIGLAGEVYHDNFLVSSQALYEGGSDLFDNAHDADDYDTTPQDTTYDNYFWRKSYSAFQLLDGELYFVDSTLCTINKYDDGKIEEIYDCRTRWNKYWNLYCRLSTDGEALFYNTNRSICKFDKDTLISTEIFTPEEVDSAGMEIYGFEYKDGYLICDLSATNNYYNADVLRIDKLYEKSNDEVLSVVPTSISLISPFEVIYCPVGTVMDVSQLQLEITYNNGSQRLIKEGFTVSELESDTPGTKTIYVTWEGIVTSFDVHVYACGDANGDGKLSVADATTIQKYLASLVDLSDTQKAAGEVTGDNKLTVADATKIQKYLAGILTELA